jgi:hypothetical protein
MFRIGKVNQISLGHNGGRTCARLRAVARYPFSWLPIREQRAVAQMARFSSLVDAENQNLGSSRLTGPPTGWVMAPKYLVIGTRRCRNQQREYC